MTGDNLRAASWTEFIGQARMKHELDIRIKSALAGQRPLEHLLIVGPPGAGKTTLASIIGAQLGEPTEMLTMPVSHRALCNVVRQHDGCLFLDEVHSLSKRGQEDLLPLVLDGYIQMPNGQRLQAGWLTVIAATTEKHKVIPPLLQRFTVLESEPYSDDEMTQIVIGMAEKIEVTLPDDIAICFGRAALGTPRTARKFVLAYRDIELATGVAPSALEALDFCRTEGDGLSFQHMEYLNTLALVGGTKGLKVLATLMRVNESVLTEIERVLVAQGFITLTDSGRELSRAGYNRLRTEGSSSERRVG